MIKVNKIKCNHCGDIIESTSVHDFKFCKCGKCAVDGGHAYLRRVGYPQDWTELSEETIDSDEIKQNIHEKNKEISNCLKF